MFIYQGIMNYDNSYEYLKINRLNKEYINFYDKNNLDIIKTTSTYSSTFTFLANHYNMNKLSLNTLNDDSICIYIKFAINRK